MRRESIRLMLRDQSHLFSDSHAARFKAFGPPCGVRQRGDVFNFELITLETISRGQSMPVKYLHGGGPQICKEHEYLNSWHLNRLLLAN